jgi:DNA-binding transcriptional MocR family regulator
MTQLLKSGELETHIQTVLCPAYKHRYTTMITSIQTHLVPLGVKIGEVSFGPQAIFGGYFIWLEMPNNINAETVTEMAKSQENLIVAPGRIFEVSGDDSVRFPSSIRLCFSWEEVEGLDESIVRLKRVVEDVLAAKEVVKVRGADGSSMKQDLGEFK